ncbi:MULTISPECIES: ImmA/IrrE family metallo-endopeptidase [unclassified Bradyrhizobium]|uniref:ImmA/IrrE family metallo-endopeptidase n=1 Tax=Bradyrhizobium TaxID=374 RepID=UPI001CD1CDD8|nr:MULTISPECIES: ImmA/IrrE family metallo-endopeptidase [unclassified Bradyrhizobium]MCA1372307.1 ImmA/IrrE family metallo-endopeptidase [Bradyrhizobium sp. IC4060]MCA1482566.1 ImmA/IrrE family metallo-endopeptidase [Bradyrhizobium sp. IC4061]
MDHEEHDDRRVTRRSNDECRRIAQNTKAYFGIKRIWPVYIGQILRSNKILTLRGEKPLRYHVVDDHVLGTKDARTEEIDGTIVITAKRTIDSQACWGDDRPRMTLAHELGHAVLHATSGAIDHRPTGAAGTTSLSKINASESAEHQAKVFASAFLIDDLRAAELASPFEISAEFIVSLSAAEICYERLQIERERAEAAARVLKSNEAHQALMRRNERRPNYLQAICPACKSQTLLPLATKVGCESCGYVGDHPEDG